MMTTTTMMMMLTCVDGKEVVCGLFLYPSCEEFPMHPVTAPPLKQREIKVSP